MTPSLLIIGFGNMGQALLARWRSSGLVPADQPVWVIDPHLTKEAQALLANHDHVAGHFDDFKTPPPLEAVTLWAVKPQIFYKAVTDMPAITTAVQGAVVSIMAGMTLGQMAQAYHPHTSRSFVRAMPNTAAMVGEGMTGLCAQWLDNDAETQLHPKVTELFKAVGHVAWLADEGDMHALTALSGSGPAYVFHMVEAMADAGAQLGLEPEMALQLARQTVVGAAKLMADRTEDTPATLRQQVTSQGGTTSAALSILMRGNSQAPESPFTLADMHSSDSLQALLTDALAAAIQRSKDLGS